MSPAGIVQLAKVHRQEAQAEGGDKMAGRHGNKV
jgi:DNA-directed RNA polymerase beta subunit